MSAAGVAIVALRESLEALLVVGILVGIVTKLGHPEARRPIWLGGLAGAALSVAVGVATYRAAGGLSERFGASFEAAASLVAVAILTYMVVWMYRHTMQAMGTLHDKAKDAVLSNRSAVLWGLAFVVVLREGLETVLFIAAQAAQTTPTEVLLGLAIGVAVSVALAVLLFRGVVRLSLQGFFAITGLILILVGGGLLGYAAHEAEEAGWAPETPQAWDWSSTLPHKCGDEVTANCVVGGFLYGLIGYRSTPAVLDLAVWALYVGAMAAWYLRPILRHRRQARAGQAG
ncbi:MAG TPA: FTR1 family protein [Candidatus Thermoplasmatota archaeon]|nr:FTR1 family protein [Candidatus Thermoplasmatota archaeon]